MQVNRKTRFSIYVSIAVGFAAVGITSFEGEAATTTCNSVAACVFAQNTSGYGVEGMSATNQGVVGVTSQNATSAATGKAGVVGYDKSTNGNPYNTGVYGDSAAAIGVKGQSTTNVGVDGLSQNGFGVVGSTGMNATSAANATAGVSGYDKSTNGNALNAGVYGYSPSGAGISGVSTHGYGVLASSLYVSGSIGASIKNGVVNGALVSANLDTFDNNWTGEYGPMLSTYSFINSRSTEYSPDILSGVSESNISSGNWDVYTQAVLIDGVGNMTLAGSIATNGTAISRTRTSSGKQLATFSARSSSPSIEDMGEGELLKGQAYVQLDPGFRSAIDQHSKYLVFVTPQGDNRGLFVTHISSKGFAVRESGGGQSTLAFDYRIVGRPYGEKAIRMPPMSAFKQFNRATRTLIPHASYSNLTPKR